MLIASAIIGAAGAMGIQFIFVLLKSTRSRAHARKLSIRRSAEIGVVRLATASRCRSHPWHRKWR
jgi:hypothetical protein